MRSKNTIKICRLEQNINQKLIKYLIFNKDQLSILKPKKQLQIKKKSNR